MESATTKITAEQPKRSEAVALKSPRSGPQEARGERVLRQLAELKPQQGDGSRPERLPANHD